MVLALLLTIRKDGIILQLVIGIAQTMSIPIRIDVDGPRLEHLFGLISGFILMIAHK